jgi:uncharacterized protein (TIGR02453 family)
MPSTPGFTPETLRFLRALTQHNDRDWFRAHRDAYESDVRRPMMAIVERLAVDLPAFAPELAASPRVSMYRLYRDTRFSPDKSPFKTQVAAIFPSRALGKHQGAALYFHVAPTEVLIGGGMYRPESAHLHLVRAHLAANFRRFRTLAESAPFRRAFGAIDGEALQRMPRGFPPDHPAAKYLRFRQFLVGRKHPARFAYDPRFYRELLSLFRRMAPLVRFLNEPLLAAPVRADPLLADTGALGASTPSRRRERARPGRTRA